MRPAAMLLSLLLLPLPAVADEPFTLRQYLSVRGAVGPTISPSGNHVAFLTDITGVTQVWRVSSKGGWPDQLTFFPGGVANAAWSPARDEILVVADKDGDQKYQFFRGRSDGTGIAPLTADPKVQHQWGGWSHDGKQIFYTANSRDERYFDCYLMDVDSKRARRVFEKDAVLSVSALSGDGKTLAALAMRSEVNYELYLVDTATGKGRQVAKHTGDAKFLVIGFTPDDRSLYLATDLGREFVNLARMDVASGDLKFLSDEKHDIATALLSQDGRWLAFTTNRDGYEELSIWDTATEKSIQLPNLPRAIVALGGFSADGRQLAISINGPNLTDDVWVLDLPKAQAVQASFSSLAGIDPKTFVEPELVRYKSFDGREIPAFLYLPKELAKDGSLPVLLSIHGGPEIQEQPYFWAVYQYFIRSGYAVLAPNIRGSSGYGKAYLALDNGRKRWDALKDIAAAVDWIGQHRALDRKRVAIFGGSYGGFATLAMLTHYPDLFACGVDLYGFADFQTFLANTAPYRRPLRIAEYGDPEKDAEFFDAISPLRHVGRIKSPLLVVQGANDPIVPASESEKLVEKIRTNGGTVKYVKFADEGHGLTKLSNRIQAYEEMARFLDQILLTKHKEGPEISAPSTRNDQSGSLPEHPPQQAAADRPAQRTDANSKLAHQQMIGNLKKCRINAYFVGDSITRRWRATDYPRFLTNWNENFHGWNAANFGWGGDTIQNILWRMQHGELDGIHPKVVIVLAGTNNVGKHPASDAKVEDTVKGIKALLDTIRDKAPKATIILMGILPRNDATKPVTVMASINKINDGIAKLADGKSIRYLNVNDKLANKDGTLFEGMAEDRLHLSVKGYQVWADALKPLLTELLGPPAREDQAPPPTGDPSAGKGVEPPQPDAGKPGDSVRIPLERGEILKSIKTIR
jgi:dipeptidyl aminopeptidase/acylaminoacyl peptidase/lysophospholipase L1-like esterase